MIRPMPQLISTDLVLLTRVNGAPCAKGMCEHPLIFFYDPLDNYIQKNDKEMIIMGTITNNSETWDAIEDSPIDAPQNETEKDAEKMLMIKLLVAMLSWLVLFGVNIM